MSFRITEEYCRLAQELEAAGYFWLPRAGDWMLDRDDGSIGMLTVTVRDADYIRRLNWHLPTYVQAEEMLVQAGVTILQGEHEVAFARKGMRLVTFSREGFETDRGVCLLKALVLAQGPCEVAPRTAGR